MSKGEPEVFTIGEFEMDQAAANEERGARSTRIYEEYVQPVIAELLGSTLFIFVGCACVVGNTGLGTLQPAVAHGLALAVCILLFGEISGGHFNPAVSLSVYLCGGLSLHLLLPYILAQMVGGLAGAGLVRAVFPPIIYHASTGGAFKPIGFSSDLGLITLAEAVMTMFLTTAVTMGAVNRKTRSPMAPFGIGLTVTANILGGGLVSGACMNPARAFGPAVVANYWEDHWVYWIGPMVGALCTAFYVRLFLGDRKTRLIVNK